MKKIMALLLCFALLGANLLPAAAAEATAPTGEYTGPNGSDVMAIICLVLAVGGIIYLVIHFKKSGRNR